MYLPLSKYVQLLVYIFITIPALSQAQTPNIPASPNSELAYSVVVTGNTGEANARQIVTPILSQLLPAVGKNSSVVFIGNPLYPQTLPDNQKENRATEENKLKEQLAPLSNYEGKAMIIPGAPGGKTNRDDKAYRRQEAFITTHLQNEKIFVPEGGCPGPLEIHINQDILLILLDTRRLLPGNEITDEFSTCPATRPSQVVALIDDILRNYDEKQVIVAANVPQTIKPMEYKYLRRNFAQFFKQHPGLIYIENNGSALRHSFSDSIHYVSVGNKAGQIKLPKGEKELFAADTGGVARVNFYKNGEAWLEFITAANPGNAAGQVAYRTLIMRKPTQAMVAASLKGQHFDYSDSVKSVSASTDYIASNFRKWLMGENYREEWATKIELPYFDIGQVKGGLKVVQQGGGFQTRSLRLADSTGREYVLRSVEKYPAAALPRPLRKTIAADVVKDQISASHPYAPLTLSSLADAAKIYHTNPQYFYIPDDPRLGKYRAGFANTVGLFEERPDEDQSDAPHFGNSKNVKGTEKVLENLQEDNDNKVDQKAVVRARLFDFIIGDWDRHDDQWRWASFEKQGEKGDIFQPIPRDRDMTFFINQGVIPNIASRKWLMPKIQGFDSDIRDVAGFNFNARYFDRTFLTELSLTDWLETANDLKNSISDAEIEKSIKQLPEPIFRLSGPRIISDLKARRDALPRDAVDYYKFLAKAVNVVGSDKSELFLVERQDDNHTNVTVRKISKSGDLEQVIYQRQFKTAETEEIRLYGLGGEDEFRISGEVNKGIKVRIIGGDDKDKITDNSKVAGLSKKTYVYDTRNDNEFKFGPETKNLTSNREEVNEYDRKAFVYDYFGPLGAVEFNRDNGIQLGAGALIKTQGFKKEPFAASHRIVGRYALRTNSYRFTYDGYFTHIIKKFDLQLNLDVRAPNFNTTFFGLGNETQYDEDKEEIDFYRYTSRQYYFNAMLGRKIGKSQTLLLGPSYQRINLNLTPERFITNFAWEQDGNYDLFEAKTYGGLEFRYQLDTRDKATQPTKGVYIALGPGLYKGLGGDASDFNRLSGEISLYRTFRVPVRLTLANRTGAAKNYGDYEFFQANRLDGLSNLRGYRQNRFAGRSSFYNNTEARLKLFNFQTYLFPGSLGILGFHDVGRVWEKNENSKKWHTGYGGGIWISPVNLLVLSAEYAVSKESRMPLLRAGFLF
ncbi:MAG: BamA/TamA family outer membrane protein [Adhaeribacter sp.]